MNIETLKIFSDLAELLSFSKTAEKHSLSQSAVSQQLAQLEFTHKCQLINRKKRPITLTKEGRLLHKTAKDIIDRYEQFKNELNTLKSAVVSRINVAAIYSIGMHALTPYVKKFMMNYPKVNVHIEYMESGRIYEQVLAGDIEIGLVAIPKRDKRLDVYDFKNEDLVLVCSPKHQLAGESETDIHNVQFEKFISFERDVPTRVWIDGILQRYNIVVRPVMAFDNIETIKRAVEINSGISILPRTTITQELKSGTLKCLSFKNERFIRPTGIITRKNKIRSQAGQYLIDLLKNND